eukprot:3729732-Amphidinium_carterae.1
MIVEIEEVSQLYKNAEDRLARYGAIELQKTIQQTQLRVRKNYGRTGKVFVVEGLVKIKGVSN